MIEKNKILDEKELDKVSGGYIGSDKYSEKSYKEAGVTWTFNYFSPDTYTIIENGKEKYITQAEAEKIAFAYHKKYEYNLPGGGPRE